MSGGLGDFSMTELFRMEADTALAALTEGLLALERGDASPLEAMMRAAHSLKGAARIVGIGAAVRVAHAMEDVFVAAQRGDVTPGRAHVDRLLAGVDLLSRIARSSDAEAAAWDADRKAEIDAFLDTLARVVAGESLPAAAAADASAAQPPAMLPAQAAAEPAKADAVRGDAAGAAEARTIGTVPVRKQCKTSLLNANASLPPSRILNL
jgi:two-component system sensor histidine kinase and response regulator WspE